MSGSPLDLDPEQAAAASVEPDVRQIVLAPPGSGKTEVVAALIENLVERHGLSPADEILVISFSRAAVGALRRRLPEGAAAPAIGVRTLDSLASRLLDELDEQEWQHLSFDSRIKRVRQLLLAGAESEELGLVRYLVVDEVQDLVGVRAQLVLTLLEGLREDVGFTLLGDPRQAVFNFQLDSVSDMTSGEFLRRAAEIGAVTERQLCHQYRARSKEAKNAWNLSARAACDDDWIREVRTFTAKLFMAGDVACLAVPMGRWGGTSAFLCRTNGEALIVGSALREAGRPVTIRSTAEDLPVASWVADALVGSGGRRITREEGVHALEGVAPMGGERAWRLLKSVERDYRRADRLDLSKVAARIELGDVPTDLLADPGSVVVSTIHRAKGLEFDNVVLVNPGDLLPGGATADDAAVAYVALTRARDQIIGARCELPRGLQIDRATKRWMVGGFKPWQTFGFEVRGSDTGTGEDMDLGPVRSVLVPGMPVTAKLDADLSSLEVPIYFLLVDGHPVARTTWAFGETLARRIGAISKRRSAWPMLDGLAVESMETVAARQGLSGDHVLRLGVRVGGLAVLTWGSKEGAGRA